MTFAVFMAVLLILTIVLFIWSNSSDGAWVLLQASPIIPDDADDHQWSLPFIFSFASLNNQLSSSTKQAISKSILNQNNAYNKLNTLSSALMKTNNLNIFDNQVMETMNSMNISDLSLNENIFHFSLMGSVEDFWQSGAYTLAILIALFSGIWPYIKLLALCACWIIPMTQEIREGILIFLDQMGKFSFIDLFVSCYMLVSFYVDINEQLPHNGYGINLKVVVEPDVGLNTFVIGTIISMIFSHFFLYLDAKYAKPDIKQLMAMERRRDRDDNVPDEEYQINIIQNKHEWNISFTPFFKIFTIIIFWDNNTKYDVALNLVNIIYDN